MRWPCNFANKDTYKQTQSDLHCGEVIGMDILHDKRSVVNLTAGRGLIDRIQNKTDCTRDECSKQSRKCTLKSNVTFGVGMFYEEKGCK